MKTFLFVFLFALSLKADTIYQGKCVSYFYYNQINSVVSVFYSDTSVLPSSFSTSDFTIIDSLVLNQDKFEFYNPKPTVKKCLPKTKTNNQILISSLTGILIGFTILFFAIFLTIKVGSRK